MAEADLKSNDNDEDQFDYDILCILKRWSILKISDPSSNNKFIIDEDGFLTLTLENWVDCFNVVSSYAILLINHCKGTMAEQRKWRFVNILLIRWNQRRQLYESRPELLPSDICPIEGNIIIPMLVDQHCSFSLVNFSERRIFYYDSMPSYHKKETLEDYMNILIRLLHNKYCIELGRLGGNCSVDDLSCWSYKVHYPVVQKDTHECGILTLKMMQCVLASENPEDLSPDMIPEYRNEIIDGILRESPKAQKLLKKIGDKDKLIKLLQSRHKYHGVFTKLLNYKSKMQKEMEKLEQINTWRTNREKVKESRRLGILEECTKLEQKITNSRMILKTALEQGKF